MNSCILFHNVRLSVDERPLQLQWFLGIYCKHYGERLGTCVVALENYYYCGIEVV